MRLFHEGNVDEAIAALKEALKLDRGLVRARFVMAECLDRKNSPEEAIRHYRDGLKRDGNNAAAHFDFGNLLFRNGRMDEAIRQFMITLVLSPQQISARYMLACCLEKTGLVAEALQEYKYILKIAPDYLETHLSAAGCLERLGRSGEAIGEYRAVLAADPGRTGLRRTIAKLLEREGLLGDAITEYRAILIESPELAEVHLRLAACLEKKGLVAEAIAEYSAALRLNSDNEVADARLEKLQGAKTRLDRNLDYYFAQALRPEAQCDSRLREGAELYARGEYDEALFEFGQRQPARSCLGQGRLPRSPHAPRHDLRAAGAPLRGLPGLRRDPPHPARHDRGQGQNQAGRGRAEVDALICFVIRLIASLRPVKNKLFRLWLQDRQARQGAKHAKDFLDQGCTHEYAAWRAWRAYVH